MARGLVWWWFIGGFVLGCSDRSSDENVTEVSQKMVLGAETEPNGAVAQATPLTGLRDVIRGNIVPVADVDYYSFTAAAGDRVYAATQTATSSSGSNDSLLTLLGSDGTTVLETDDNNGNFGLYSSGIAGAPLPAAGTYYFRVSNLNAALEIRPYRMHFQKRNGTPAAEVEPNDVLQNVLPGLWYAGEISTATDVDQYRISLNAGDTVFGSLDLDPERDGSDFNGALGMGLFSGVYISYTDDGVAPAPDSETYFMTVRSAGDYTMRVSSEEGTGNYHLSVSVYPAPSTAGCLTYTNSTPLTIPAGPATVTSTLNVPDNLVIGDVNVNLALTHGVPPDLDVHLISPAGGRTGLFTDVGHPSFPFLALTVDDEAGIPITLNVTSVMNGMRLQPEPEYRLSWFDGEQARGIWTLELRDDQAVAGGTLTSWGITVCPAVPALACQSGSVPRVVFSTDFETSDGGFTHSGTADEWARGTPSAAPITTCNGGTQCFKTDLAGTYNASSNQNLVSPPIDLAASSGPYRVRWAQKLQMGNATTDHAWVAVRNVDDSNTRRIYEFLDGNMTDSIGSPPVTVNESAGWSIQEADISEYAGGSIELVFHVDSDATTNLAGLAIDDVSVLGACVPGGAGAGGGGGIGGGGVGAGGASGGVGGVAAGAGGASAGGRSGAAGRAGMGGVAGSGEGGEPGGGGEAGATGGEAGTTGTGGSAGSSAGTSTGGSAGGSGGDPGEAGAGGETDDTPPGTSSDDDGCGCRVAGKQKQLGSWTLLALAVSAAAVRRRRRIVPSN